MQHIFFFIPFISVRAVEVSVKMVLLCVAMRFIWEHSQSLCLYILQQVYLHNRQTGIMGRQLVGRAAGTKPLIFGCIWFGVCVRVCACSAESVGPMGINLWWLLAICIHINSASSEQTPLTHTRNKKQNQPWYNWSEWRRNIHSLIREMV